MENNKKKHTYTLSLLAILIRKLLRDVNNVNIVNNRIHIDAQVQA